MTDQEKYEELCKTAPFIIGADECGYGSWAGPLVTCAVAVPRDWHPPRGLDDSKKLRADKREYYYSLLTEKVSYAVGMAHSDEIDQGGVIPALHRCYLACIQKVSKPGAIIVIDGEVNITELEHLRFPKADGIVPAVMAASVIGKVTHDHYMLELARQYPGYLFEKHQGYGTPDHKKAILKLGMTPVHRKSYVPIEGKTTGRKIQSERGLSLDEVGQV